jgi:hypothetical protein
MLFAACSWLALHCEARHSLELCLVPAESKSQQIQDHALPARAEGGGTACIFTCQSSSHYIHTSADIRVTRQCKVAAFLNLTAICPVLPLPRNPKYQYPNAPLTSSMQQHAPLLSSSFHAHSRSSFASGSMTNSNPSCLASYT